MKEIRLVILMFIASLLALLFAFVTSRKVLKFSEGTPLMQKISMSIRQGANAYLKRQYKIVGVFFGAMFLLLGVMAIAGFLTPYVPFAFITGGFFSALSGFIGMKIATLSNARTANACCEGLNKGLRVAFSAGGVMGFTVVGLGLLDISVWFFLLKFVFKLPNEAITSAMLTFGMGASSMALFARVGGGIFTKAADVGADLVGKVEAGIPEDDPRNPAVIADNVGDNVGDVAGMGADLYESYVGSIISSFALGIAAFHSLEAMALPILLAALGVPKQEKWLAAHINELNIPVSIGVGGTLDVMAGVVRRAPLWMQRARLEWLFRAMLQPSRAGRLLALPKFVLQVHKQKLNS